MSHSLSPATTAATILIPPKQISQPGCPGACLYIPLYPFCQHFGRKSNYFSQLTGGEVHRGSIWIWTQIHACVLHDCLEDSKMKRGTPQCYTLTSHYLKTTKTNATREWKASKKPINTSIWEKRAFSLRVQNWFVKTLRTSESQPAENMNSCLEQRE